MKGAGMSVKNFIKQSNQHSREQVLEAATRKARHLRDVAETLDAIVKAGDVERLADSMTYTFADTDVLRHEAALVAEGTRLIKLIEDKS